MLRLNQSTRLWIFLFVLAALSSLPFLLPLHASNNLSSMLTMFAPGMAALIAILLTSRDLATIGWKPGPVRMLLLAWALPAVFGLVVYGPFWMRHTAEFPSPQFLERAARTLGMAGKNHLEIVMAAFGYLATMGLLNPGALAEEIGWRGFLFPEFFRRYSFLSASLLTGMLWGVWHWPAMLFRDYRGGTPLPFEIACLTAMTCSTSVILCWLRLRSESIWPCFVMHAVHNSLIQRFFDRITPTDTRTPWITSEFGFGLIVPTTLIAFFCWRDARRNSWDAKHASSIRLRPEDHDLESDAPSLEVPGTVGH